MLYEIILFLTSAPYEHDRDWPEETASKIVVRSKIILGNGFWYNQIVVCRYETGAPPSPVVRSACDSRLRVFCRQNFAFLVFKQHSPNRFIRLTLHFWIAIIACASPIIQYNPSSPCTSALIMLPPVTIWLR